MCSLYRHTHISRYRKIIVLKLQKASVFSLQEDVRVLVTALALITSIVTYFDCVLIKYITLSDLVQGRYIIWPSSSLYRHTRAHAHAHAHTHTHIYIYIYIYIYIDTYPLHTRARAPARSDLSNPKSRTRLLFSIKDTLSLDRRPAPRILLSFPIGSHLYPEYPYIPARSPHILNPEHPYNPV